MLEELVSLGQQFEYDEIKLDIINILNAVYIALHILNVQLGGVNTDL